MSSGFRRRSKIRQALEEVQASDKEAGDSLGMDVDEDEDVLSEEQEDVMDEDEESDKEQREREDVLLQLSDPRMRSSRHQKAAMADPTPVRVRKRKPEESEEGAADKPHACSHCGKRFGALAAMWGHQSRCAARSQNLNLEPHPFDRPKKLEPPPPPPSRTSSRAKKPTGPQEEFPCEDCGKVFPVAMRLYGHMSRCAARLRRLGKHPDSKGAKKVARPAPAEEPEEEEEEEDDAEAEDEGSPVNTPPGSPAEESDAPIVLRLKRPGSSAPSEPEPFMCSECGKSFTSAHALGGHKGSHRNREEPHPSKPERTAEGGYQCGVCGLIFGNGQALGGHKGSHKPTDVYTEEEKEQNAKRGLLGPVTALLRRRTVENAAEGGWACDVCGLVFSTGQALGGHKGSHKSTDYYTEEEKQSNKRRSSLQSEDTPETQLKKALAALKKTMQIADAKPFNIPVDAEGLGIPDYVEVVKNPMDLGTVRTKLEKNEYPGVAEMLADVRLVSANCRLYNNEADPIVEMLEVVERRFKSEWVKAGLPLDEQGNPAAPEQEDSGVEEGGSELEGGPGASPQRARRVRFAPGIQSPPLRTRPQEAPTDIAEPEEQPQEPGPRRGRGRPPGRVGSKLALKTGISKHRPNCPCVICKQARKSPRGGRFKRDGSDGESERQGGRGDALQASHSSDEEEDGAEAAEAPEDDAPRAYYAKGAHLPPAQLSPATWRLGYQLFANSTGAMLQAANSKSGKKDDSRLAHRSGLATSAEQDALVPVGVNVGQPRHDGSTLGPLSSRARRMGPEDVRAALAELLGSHIGVEQACM